MSLLLGCTALGVYTFCLIETGRYVLGSNKTREEKRYEKTMERYRKAMDSYS